MTLDLVVFDLDGTLVQLDFTGEGMRQVRSNLQAVFTEVDVNREFKPLLVDLERAFDEVSHKTNADTAEQIRQRAFEQVASMECDAVSRQKVYEEASSAMERVGASGATLAVATNNTRRAAIESLSAAKLPNPDEIVAIDDIGRPKPNPKMIEVLLDQVDPTPTEFAIIGDRRSDAESARQACEGTDISAQTVLLDRDGDIEVASSDIDYTVTSLVEALNVLSIKGSEKL